MPLQNTLHISLPRSLRPRSWYVLSFYVPFLKIFHQSNYFLKASIWYSVVDFYGSTPRSSQNIILDHSLALYYSNIKVKELLNSVSSIVNLNHEWALWLLARIQSSALSKWQQVSRGALERNHSADTGRHLQKATSSSKKSTQQMQGSFGQLDH